MRTRENEVHKPKIVKWKEPYGAFAYAYCINCKAELAIGEDDTSITRATQDMYSHLPNYCPYCGARLRGRNKPQDND